MHYKKNKNKILFIMIIFIIIMFFIITTIKVLPSFKKVDYKKSIGVNSNDISVNIQFDNINIDTYPIYKDEEIYIPVDFVKNYIDKYIYWDKDENTLTITNEKNVIRMKTDELEYFVNSEPLGLDFPIYNINGVAYLPKIFLEDFYGVSFNYIKNTKILNMIKNNYKEATLEKSTFLRTLSDKKSPYIRKLKKGETIYFSEDSNEKYTKVMTLEGYTGYVLTKNIKNEKEVNFTMDYENDYISTSNWKVKDGKINLIFDQVSNVDANSNEKKRVYHEGVDVLAPTWFSFKDESGKIVNIADKSYVNWAHNNGYKVWGLITDNFNTKISHSVLSSTEKREYVIKQLLAYVSSYDLDGINIDFESVPKKDGDNFIQFLRELSPPLKEAGAVLSVDLFVPKPWTSHYQRNEVGKIVDYVIVMGYDEHYAGSESAGSVASLNWSEIAIKDTLAEGVPKEKLILGIPFYTRIWTETKEGSKINLKSKAYGMNGSYKFMEEKNAKFSYDEKTQQMYAEAIEGNVKYRVWLEDENSLKKRLDIVNKYDIAGIGAWKRGLEKEEVWDILKEKLKS